MHRRIPASSIQSAFLGLVGQHTEAFFFRFGNYPDWVAEAGNSRSVVTAGGAARTGSRRSEFAWEAGGVRGSGFPGLPLRQRCHEMFFSFSGKEDELFMKEVYSYRT